MAVTRTRRDDAGVASHASSRTHTTSHNTRAETPAFTDTPLSSSSSSTSQATTTHSSSRSGAAATAPAVNVALPPPQASTSSYYDIFPVLASIEAALGAQPATNPGAVPSVPFGVLPASIPPTTSTVQDQPPATLTTSSIAHRASATAPSPPSADDHPSLLAALVTGGAILVLVGIIAAWHAFRRAQRRWAAPTPVFGGMTPHSFRSASEIGWEKFDGMGASASAANDLAHRPPVAPAQTPATQRPAPTPAGELRGMIGRPQMVGLGYEPNPYSYSIYMPTKPAPAPPIPTIMVASASADPCSDGNIAGIGIRSDSSKTLVRQPSIKTPGPLPPARVLERKLSERQTKVLTRALGLNSPPNTGEVDLDLYRYTRYELEDDHSVYLQSPPVGGPVDVDASALGQLLLDCPPTPIPEQAQAQTAVTAAASSPGLAYLASTWSVANESSATAPLKVQRKNTPRHLQGPGGAAARKKRASLLPKLNFPLPPTDVRPPGRSGAGAGAGAGDGGDLWDEAVAK